MDKNRFWESIKYFKPEEFAAPGVPDSGLMMRNFLIIGLDEFRGLIGYPVHINPNGGFSFKGHSDNSFHYEGEAVDFHIDPKCKISPREQMRVLLSLGKFGGVGFYPEWGPVPGFHVDVRQRFQLWVKRKEEYIYIFASGPEG